MEEKKSEKEIETLNILQGRAFKKMMIHELLDNCRLQSAPMHTECRASDSEKGNRDCHV